ncbi:MAG: M48 family metalloprotease [Syntrophorhabdaceae bacterium]|nr:M48 family metalloprotease [Syntrophorhabdaceae bacterium]
MKRVTAVLLSLILFLPLSLSCLTIEEETRAGREIFFEIGRSANINNDPYLTIYTRNLKERIEASSSLPFPITLTIIESNSVDAFATVGGYVFITTGLIGFCEKEEELAGVIAHEFAHIAKRHVAKRLEKDKIINAGMLAAVLLGMLLPDPAMKSAVITTGTASSVTMALKYSRDDEEEADRFGSNMAIKAGYSPLGTVDFLKRLRAGGGDKMLPQYLLTHPYHEERILRLESLWPDYKREERKGFFPFLAARARILYGPGNKSQEEIWKNRYERDRKDPVGAYGLSLLYSLKGDSERAVEVAKSIDSPYRDLLLGEILVNVRRFADAVEVLKNVNSPIGRYYLARAYEGLNDREKAIGALKDIIAYGDSYPDIFYRYGMLEGRAGNEAAGYAYLGKYYLVIGRIAQAKINIEKAIAKYGVNSKEAQELLKLIEPLDKKGEGKSGK